MPPAVPVVGALAGAAAGSAAAFGGFGFATAAFGVLPWSTAALAINAGLGFIVSTAVNQLGSRALSKKPKAQAFTQEAQGRSIMIRSSVETHKLVYGTARVSGVLVHAATTDSGSGTVTGTRDNKLLHLVVALAGHEVEMIDNVYFNDQQLNIDVNGVVTSGPYYTPSTAPNSHAVVRKFTGSEDQEAFAQMVAEIPGWTTAHRGRGVAYLWVRLEFSNDVFPNGIPNISAVVKGKKVYDPRTGLTEWSENPALCTRDYLLNECGVATTRFDDSYTTASANACEESVALRAGGTQDRYTCNGVVDTGVSRRDNLQALIASMAGEVVRVGNKVRIFAGAYDTHSGAITDDMLAGELVVRGRTPRSDLVNTVRGTYVDPNKSWQPTDFPPVTNSAYVAQDNGQAYTKDLELAFTNHPEMGQRIAKLIMEKARQGITVDAPLNHAALKFATWDTVTYTQEHLGWSSKVFRIKGMKMDRVPEGAIRVVLQEESSASYDWNSGEATLVDPAPDTNLPDPSVVAAPGNPAVAEQKYVTSDGSGVKTKAIVTWGASTDGFLRDYQLEYKLAAATEWTVLSKIASTTQEILDIAAGIYDFRVKALNTLGVSSEYATTSGKEIIGLGDRPDDIENLTGQAISSLMVLRWDPLAEPDNLDVTRGGYILIRHSSDTTGATWEGSISIGEALPGNSNMAVLPLKEGTYLVKARDSLGLTSVNAATVSTNNASVLAFSTIATVQEDPTFPGIKAVGAVAIDGVLKLQGEATFNSIEDFDSIDSLDDWGGVKAFGQYTFAAGIDLGSVQRVRLETLVEALTVNVNDSIDSRTANIDDWLDFDGTAGGGSTDVEFYCRATDDDPSGSPTWGEWNRIHIGDYEARAFQFYVRMTSSDPAYNVHVSRLRVTAKEVT
jgi:hypothetical protein